MILDCVRQVFGWFQGFSSVFQRRFSYAVFGRNFPRCFLMEAFLREMFSSLACAMAMRVNDGVFFFLGLYSGSLTNGDVFLGSGSF